MWHHIFPSTLRGSTLTRLRPCTPSEAKDKSMPTYPWNLTQHPQVHQWRGSAALCWLQGGTGSLTSTLFADIVFEYIHLERWTSCRCNSVQVILLEIEFEMVWQNSEAFGLVPNLLWMFLSLSHYIQWFNIIYLTIIMFTNECMRRYSVGESELWSTVKFQSGFILTS